MIDDETLKKLGEDKTKSLQDQLDVVHSVVQTLKKLQPGTLARITSTGEVVEVVSNTYFRNVNFLAEIKVRRLNDPSGVAWEPGAQLLEPVDALSALGGEAE